MLIVSLDVLEIKIANNSCIYHMHGKTRKNIKDFAYSLILTKMYPNSKD